MKERWRTCSKCGEIIAPSEPYKRIPRVVCIECFVASVAAKTDSPYMCEHTKVSSFGNVGE